ncbi:MAG: helix-turn-helix transcriptional regulator [Lentisphaerae bacterium]|nr:helix-turn-helix transcriptional regulator [Lentisphaerota bacterium]
MKNLKLKGAIVASGYTYEKLAKEIDVSTPIIQRAVNGKHTSIENANAICKALDKSLNELFGE